MSDLLYRQSLEEKLNDILVDLNTGRGLFSNNSRKFIRLKKTIDAVLGFLESHNGEEWLEKKDKEELEDNVDVEANKPDENTEPESTEPETPAEDESWEDRKEE